MYFWDAVRVLMRRWYVAGPLALLALVGAVGVYKSVGAKYRTDATVLLLMPNKPPDAKAPVNPYLDFQGSLFATADVISRVVDDDATAKRLRANGDSANYVVTVGTSMTAPLLAVTVQDGSPNKATKTMHDLVREIQTTLVARQQATGAPPDTWVRTTLVSASAKPSILTSSKVRGGAATGGGLMLVAILLTFLVEGAANRRRQQRPAAVVELMDGAPEDGSREERAATLAGVAR